MHIEQVETKRLPNRYPLPRKFIAALYRCVRPAGIDEFFLHIGIVDRAKRAVMNLTILLAEALIIKRLLNGIGLSGFSRH